MLFNVRMPYAILYYNDDVTHDNDDVTHDNDDVTHVQRLSQGGTAEDADSEENIRVANDLRTDLRTQPLR